MLNKPANINFTLFLLWIGHLLVDLMIGIWPVFKTIAHLDLAVAGIISSIAAFAGEGAQIYFGPLSDKGYTRILIVLGLLITCANVLLPYASTSAMILALFFLTCLGSGAFHPSAAGLTSGLTDTRKSLFMTIFASGGSIGIAFSQIIFTQAFQVFDRHIYLLAIPSILLAGLIFFFCKGVATPKLSSSHPITKQSLLGLFRHRELRLLYFMQISNQALFWGIVFLLPDTLLSRGYDQWIYLGGAHLFFMLGGAAMMILSGYLADKYSPKNVILVAASGSLILFNLFFFSNELSTYLLLPLIFFNGASLGIINPVIVSMGNRLMPSNPGMVSAFLMGMAWCISEVIGLGGTGLMTKLFEEDAPAKTLAILSVVCLISCFLITLRLPKIFVPATVPETDLN